MAERTRVTPSPRSFACDLATLCCHHAGRAQTRQPLPLPARARAGRRRHGSRLARSARAPRRHGAGAQAVPAYRGRAGLCLPPRARVARLLADPRTLDFLAGEGYALGTADALLNQLADRLCCEGEFPHEIGVFLGYPLADVIGFIENRGKNFTACGYWKVYRPHRRPGRV